MKHFQIIFNSLLNAFWFKWKLIYYRKYCALKMCHVHFRKLKRLTALLYCSFLFVINYSWPNIQWID